MHLPSCAKVAPRTPWGPTIVLAIAAFALGCADAISPGTPIAGSYVLQSIAPSQTLRPFGQWTSVTRVADTARFTGTKGVFISVIHYSGPNGDLVSREIKDLRVYLDARGYLVEQVCPINAGCILSHYLIAHRGDELVLVGKDELRTYERINSP